MESCQEEREASVSIFFKETLIIVDHTFPEVRRLGWGAPVFLRKTWASSDCVSGVMEAWLPYLFLQVVHEGLSGGPRKVLFTATCKHSTEKHSSSVEAGVLATWSSEGRGRHCLASHISPVNPSDQRGDRTCSQIALQSWDFFFKQRIAFLIQTHINYKPLRNGKF